MIMYGITDLSYGKEKEGGIFLINIFEKGKALGDKYMPEESFLEVYRVPGEEERPFVIVFPGGGYHHLAGHEGKDIAEWFNQRGIHAGIFYYQLKNLNLDRLLKQVNDLVQELREHAAAWQLSPDSIGVIGFSAGGHLAALCSTKNEYKPDFSILSYPVISVSRPHLHLDMLTQVLGAEPDEELSKQYSPDYLITETTPKTFIWHTAEDKRVPVENVLLYAQQLGAHQIPFELHIFEAGRHGLGLAKEEPYTQAWSLLLEKWLEKNQLTPQGEKR